MHQLFASFECIRQFTALVHPFGFWGNIIGLTPNRPKLTELFCVEKSGFIWACLNPDVKYNLSDWMNEFKTELDDIGLKNWYIFKSTTLNGPRWKICWDGYLDG